MVLQDPFLFTGTIAENIRLGSDWITDERMKAAADEVNVGDFIRALPQGFDEPLRERGNSLSTGQKQLINFARALAHDPRILVLDEATSSVDTDTEMRVRSALERMVQGRTSVIVAHRLSTVQQADRILVMHKGQLRELGTHQELLGQRGIYWKLYQLQYKDQEVRADGLLDAKLAVGTDLGRFVVRGLEVRICSIPHLAHPSIRCWYRRRGCGWEWKTAGASASLGMTKGGVVLPWRIGSMRLRSCRPAAYSAVERTAGN